MLHEIRHVTLKLHMQCLDQLLSLLDSNEATVLFYIMLATWLRLILTEITICKSEISKK